MEDLYRSCKDLDRSCKDFIFIHQLPEKKRARKSSKSSETVLDGTESTKIGKCASQSFKRKRIIFQTNDQLVCDSAPINTNQVHPLSATKNHSQQNFHQIENLTKQIQELETSIQKLSTHMAGAEWGAAEWARGTEWCWASGDPPSYIS